MAHRYRARRILRRLRRARPAAGKQHAQPVVSLERLLTLPVMDRMLGRAVAHPRLLQWIGVLIGLLIMGLSLRPLFVADASARPAVQSGSAAAQSAPPDEGADRQGASDEQSEPLAVVAAYNQASITAALLGRADGMAPYLASDGTAWAEVQAEYQRRAARGETHAPTLTRWGVLQVAVAHDTAQVETQEQWDDITSVGGVVISSRRGILTHNTYELRRVAPSGRWQITTVTSVSVIS